MKTLIEGPLGFPMTDQSARRLQERLKQQPSGKEFEYHHIVVTKAPTEVNSGERSDVSWISTESPDRDREIVLAKGMDDSQFMGNPLVTLQHCYWMQPVGKSLWHKRVKDGGLVGIKAKTVYPARPESWPADKEWISDQVLTLIQTGLLNGKSIGFLPTVLHAPTTDEVKRRPELADVRLIIDEWILLEYAVCFLPANQDALVESVSNGLSLSDDFLKAIGIKAPLQVPPPPLGRPDPQPPFTALSEVQAAIDLQVAKIDFDALTRQSMQNALDRARGRI